jgi:type I restriction enzyme S subunit
MTGTTNGTNDMKRELPAGWRWAQLGEVCEDRTGSREPRTEPDKSFRYVDISSVDNVQKRIVEARTVKGSEAPSRARQVIRHGDVLVATTRPNLNAVARVPPELDGEICSTGFCVLRPRPGLNSDYLFAFVRHEAFVSTLSDLVKGALYPAVTDSQVKTRILPLAPLAEQERIAALLNEQMAAVERARAAAQAQLEEAKALPAAYLRQVFLRSEATRWPIRPLGEVAEIVSGVTLGRDVRGAPTRQIPYLRVANVKDGYLDLSEVYEIEATEAEISKLRLEYGDLLFTEGGDPDKLGRGTFWQGQLPDCIHQNHIFRARFDRRVFSPAFVSWQFGSAYGKAYFLRHAKRTTGIATINQRVLRAFPLLIPPLVGQQRIAAQLSEQMNAAEKLRTGVETQLAEVNALPAALLRRAFNGET